jgi:hypothetical protein
METIALGALGKKLLAEARAASSGRFAVAVHGGHINSLRQTARSGRPLGPGAGHAAPLTHPRTEQPSAEVLGEPVGG